MAGGRGMTAVPNTPEHENAPVSGHVWENSPCAFPVPLRYSNAAPLLQSERGCASRRGMIRTLADTFRNDIRDQEVRIN